MRHHLQTVLDLVREIEPDCELSRITFQLHLTADGLVHVASCYKYDLRSESAKEYRHDQLTHLKPCPDCLGSTCYLIAAINDPFLQHGVTSLDYFRSFGTFWTTKHILSEADERVARESYALDDYPIALAYEWDEQHSEIANEFAKRIIWSSPESHDVLQQAMELAEVIVDKAHYDVFRDHDVLDQIRVLVPSSGVLNDPDRYVLSVFGPSRIRGAVSQRETDIELTLLIAADRKARHEQVLAEVPYWLYDAMQRICPQNVYAYAYETIDTNVLDTALSLWSSTPGDLYGSFDVCVSAATRVLTEAIE